MSVRFGKEEVERSASILATRVISRLRDTFRVDLPLHRLFESPMVSALAERIETRLWAGEHFERPVKLQVKEKRSNCDDHRAFSAFTRPED
ncbi:MAG: phosphopantetheine-binding protein [Candidatus Binatia bacterium]